MKNKPFNVYGKLSEVNEDLQKLSPENAKENDILCADGKGGAHWKTIGNAEEEEF